MKNNNLKKQIADITANLIKFKTVNGEESEVLKLYDYVENLFKDTTYAVEIIEFENRPILRVVSKNSKPKIYLCCHIDVVEGGDSQFIPKIKGSKIFGRGAYDMKTQAALCIAVLLNNDLNVSLILTSDEECSENYNGAKFTADLLKDEDCIVIVPDGEAALGITDKVKGMGVYHFISKGIGTRFSYPWRGRNPYVNLMQLYLNLYKIFPDSRLATDDDYWYTTYNLISIDARDGSMVPDSGTMSIIVNCTTEFDRESLYGLVKNFAEKYACEVEENFFGAPYEVDRDEKYIKDFKMIMDKVAGYPTPLMTMGAISDVRHFSENGLKTILCRIDGAGCHAPIEYADLNSAVILYKTIEEYITKLGI